MAGPPFNYSDLTAKITIRGEGRDDTFVVRPVSPMSFIAWSPPGALNTNSMMLRQRVNLSGDTTVASVNSGGGILLDSYAPWIPTYIAVVPSTTSVKALTVRGQSADQPIKLAPNLPAIYALAPVAAMQAWNGGVGWKLIYNSTGGQYVDVYVF